MKRLVALGILMLCCVANAAITVSITSPVNGAIVSNTIPLTATASTTSGTITNVQFFSDIAFLGSVSTPPYILNYDTTAMPNGAHTFTAKAFDSTGSFALSSDISVTVTNPVLGVPNWVRDIRSVSSGVVTPFCIGVDHSTNVIVAGYYRISADFGSGPVATTSKTIFLAKYNSQNSLMWAHPIGIGSDGEARAVTVDSQNNIIIVGDFSVSLDCGGVTLVANHDLGGTSPDMFVAKYNSAGSLLWATNYGGPASDTATGVGVDQNDDILLTGSFMGTANFGGTVLTCSGPDVVLLKLPKNAGPTMWAKSFIGVSGESPNALSVDSLGDVVITGLANGSMDLGTGTNTLTGGIFVGKYSGANGTYRWSKMVNGGSGNGIAADPATGNIFITGSTSGSDFGGGNVSGPGYDVAYDSSGHYLWSGALSGVGNAIAADGNGYIAVAGSQLFIVSSTSGNRLRWSHTGSASTVGSAVTYDSNGRILEAGSFQTTVNFGGIFATPTSGATDGFVVQYQNIHFPSVNPFTFSPSTYGPLVSNQSKTITVTYTAPSDSSVSSNALVFTDNSGVTIAPITGGPAAPSNVHINGGNGNDVGVTNSTGTTLQFIANADGADPRTYSWRKTSTVIAVTTNNNFYVVSTNAQTSDSGWYDVIVSNAYGSATSQQIYVQLTDTINYNPPGVAGMWTNYGTALTSPIILSNVSVVGDNRMLLLMPYSYSLNGLSFINTVPDVFLTPDRFITGPTYNVVQYSGVSIEVGSVYKWVKMPGDIQCTSSGILLTDSGSFVASQPLVSVNTINSTAYLYRTSPALLSFTNYYSSNGKLVISYLTNPGGVIRTNTTTSIRWDFGGTVDEGAVLAPLLTNVFISSSSNAFRQPVSWSGTTADNSFSVPSTNGDLVIDAIVSSSQQFTQYAGQTLIGSVQLPAPQGTWLQMSKKVAGYPTTTMGWGSTVSDPIAHIAVAIRSTQQPIPTVQPLSTNIPLYAPFSLSIAADGSDLTSYRWKKNLSPITSTNLTGVTTTNLQFVTATTNDSGYYTALVTNQVGSIMSYPALVNIYVPPPQPVILNPPVGVTNYYGSNITFSVFASGNPTLLYQWRHNSNIIISANSPSYSKSNVSTNDQGWYDVQIANSYGNTSSVPVFASLGPLVTPPPPKVVIRGKMTIQGKAYIQ